MTSRQNINNQQGFTLIELMVVVVIISVVVSVAVVSLGRVNMDIAATEQAKIQAMMKQVSDEAAFKQRLMLLVPDENGLKVLSKVDFKWQPEQSVAFYPWHAAFAVKYEVDSLMIQRQKLPQQGWLFWPTGDVTPGQIELEIVEEGETKNLLIKWNDSLEFETPES